jgi:hypothetical protein
MPVVGPPLTQLPSEPLRWPLVQTTTWAYEASDRAHELGRGPGLLPRAVIAAYGGYAALNSATGDSGRS